MVGKVTREQAYEILHKQNLIDDRKDILHVWGPLLAIWAVVTIISIIGVIYNLVKHDYSEAVSALVCGLLFHAMILLPFYFVSIRTRKKFTQLVQAKGPDMLNEELLHEETKVFFYYPEDVDSILILTPNYLICTPQFIYAYEEIEAVTFSKHIVLERNLNRSTLNDEEKQKVRDAYNMEIVLRNGKKDKQLVAFCEDDKTQLYMELVKRCPGHPFFGLTYDGG